MHSRLPVSAFFLASACASLHPSAAPPDDLGVDGTVSDGSERRVDRTTPVKSSDVKPSDIRLLTLVRPARIRAFVTALEKLEPTLIATLFGKSPGPIDHTELPTDFRRAIARQIDRNQTALNDETGRTTVIEWRLDVVHVADGPSEPYLQLTFRNPARPHRIYARFERAPANAERETLGSRWRLYERGVLQDGAYPHPAIACPPTTNEPVSPGLEVALSRWSPTSFCKHKAKHAEQAVCAIFGSLVPPGTDQEGDADKVFPRLAEVFSCWPSGPSRHPLPPPKRFRNTASRTDPLSGA